MTTWVEYPFTRTLAPEAQCRVPGDSLLSHLKGMKVSRCDTLVTVGLCAVLTYSGVRVHDTFQHCPWQGISMGCLQAQN